MIKTEISYIAFGFQLGLKYYFQFLTMNHKESFVSQKSASRIQTVSVKLFNSNHFFSFPTRHFHSPSLMKVVNLKNVLNS